MSYRIYKCCHLQKRICNRIIYSSQLKQWISKNESKMLIHSVSKTSLKHPCSIWDFLSGKFLQSMVYLSHIETISFYIFYEKKFQIFLINFYFMIYLFGIDMLQVFIDVRKYISEGSNIWCGYGI